MRHLAVATPPGRTQDPSAGHQPAIICSLILKRYSSAECFDQPKAPFSTAANEMRRQMGRERAAEGRWAALQRRTSDILR